jgi:glyoxylase-like metal-dependent hydrolase (beta-lactamase superfamily II)
VQIERIVAPNPGPMTLTGTNTYFLRDDDGRLAVVDPGPDDIPSHLENIVATADRLGRIVLIVVTHRHLDHLPAATPLSERTGAPLAGHPDLPGVQRPLPDAQVVFGNFVALHTPGHTRDSVCLWDREDSALLTGDLVLGTGTAVLDDAPGALRDYLASLERLREFQPGTIYPGHGPVVSDGVAKLTEYYEHRQLRVRQVVDALELLGASTPEQLAAAIYVETPPNLMPMAARNVRANLDLLLGQTRVESLEGDRWQLRTG